MKEKYSDLNELSMLGFMANALDKRSSDGDRGACFPRSDAEDLSRGLRFIPGEVTLARRKGEKVDFISDCTNLCCWYWIFQDSSRIYYWERSAYELMDGSCPSCGNTHISGGHIEAAKV